MDWKPLSGYERWHPTKLLFVSQTSSPDVVREALSLGALVYVDKTHTSTDLLPAIEAVLRAEQFVSESLESSGRTDAPRRHEVQFYSCVSGIPEHLSRAHSRLLPLRTVPARMPVATDAREPKVGIGPSAREKPLQEAWCHIRRLQDPLDRACREVRSCDPAMPRGYPRNKS